MSRILIIEDEREIAMLEKDYLEASGFEVSLAFDGEDGCLLALTQPFDLVILDIMLPQLDGYQVCMKIRAYKTMPIILVSAKKEELDKIDGFDMGADDYITKPFSPRELVARVKAHLNRYERYETTVSTPKNTIEIRGIKLDKLSKMVTVNGVEKRLSNKEFDILALLMEHPGRVFTKEQIFQKVWGQEPIGDLATVSVHINKLREKTEGKDSPSGFHLIDTIWGVGYRFSV